MSNFSTTAFDAWLRSTGRCYNHLTVDEKRAAIKEFKTL
jgi:hypothetical protein